MWSSVCLLFILHSVLGSTSQESYKWMKDSKQLRLLHDKPSSAFYVEAERHVKCGCRSCTSNIYVRTPSGSNFQELVGSNLDIVLYLLLCYCIVALHFSYTIGLSVFAVVLPGFGKKITDDFGNCRGDNPL